MGARALLCPRLSLHARRPWRTGAAGPRTSAGRAGGFSASREDDDHQQGMLGSLQNLVGLEAEEPLHELEAARQLDEVRSSWGNTIRERWA